MIKELEAFGDVGSTGSLDTVKYLNDLQLKLNEIIKLINETHESLPFVQNECSICRRMYNVRRTNCTHWNSRTKEYQEHQNIRGGRQ